jgi:hypothetical protein
VPRGLRSQSSEILVELRAPAPEKLPTLFAQAEQEGLGFHWSYDGPKKALVYPVLNDPLLSYLQENGWQIVEAEGAHSSQPSRFHNMPQWEFLIVKQKSRMSSSQPLLHIPNQEQFYIQWLTVEQLAKISDRCSPSRWPDTHATRPLYAFVRK